MLYGEYITINVQVFFSDFAGNSRARKPDKEQTKRANITGVKYFRAYQQVVVSTSSYISFIVYIHYTPSLHLQQLPFSPPPSPPTDDEAHRRPLSLSGDHRSSGDASVVAPAAASDEGLPSPRLRRFVAIAIANRRRRRRRRR